MSLHDSFLQSHHFVSLSLSFTFFIVNNSWMKKKMWKWPKNLPEFQKNYYCNVITPSSDIISIDKVSSYLQKKKTMEIFGGKLRWNTLYIHEREREDKLRDNFVVIVTKNVTAWARNYQPPCGIFRVCVRTNSCQVKRVTRVTRLDVAGISAAWSIRADSNVKTAGRTARVRGDGGEIAVK